MSCNIYEYLGELKEKKDEVSSIGKEIEIKRREYEEILGQLSERFNTKRNEVAALNETIVSVRLGDFMNYLGYQGLVLIMYVHQ